MPRAHANGIDIEYEVTGPAGGPPLLLVMGLGAQLTLWPDAFVDALAAQGRRVIRFDNRDVGLSTKIEAGGRPSLPRLVAARWFGFTPRVPYTLTDMAADAIGLLDALGIERADVVGASMGGMIAQLMAANWPTRVLRLVSIMSTTGNPALPRATREAMQVLTRRPDPADLDAVVAHGIRAATVIGSPAYPADQTLLAERVRATVDRMHYPPGFVRQMAAIIADGDRRARLARITAPTLVIHGGDDPLVPVEGGRDTAASIPGARLVELPGMGHDLPAALIPQIAEEIERHLQS